jgi:hypothetical protein
MDLVQMEKRILEIQSLKDTLLQKATEITYNLKALELEEDKIVLELLRIDEAIKNASFEEAERLGSRKRELAKQQEFILEAKKVACDKIENLRRRSMKLSEEIRRLEKQIDSIQIAEQHNQSESRLEVTTNNGQTSSDNERQILTVKLQRSRFREKVRMNPEEFLVLAEKHRRTNGKINYSALAREIDVTNKTAKRWHEIALNSKDVIQKV